jgi:GTP pyrophosphokinase
MGDPYLGHLLAATSIVLEHGGTEVEAIAALLHDAVEDQGGPPVLKIIRRGFGNTVARTVEGCTAPRMPGLSWRERREKHLWRLRGASSSVRLVEAADKLANARSILREYRVFGDGLWARFNGSLEEILWYYLQCVEIFREAGPRHLAEELNEVVSEIERVVSASSSREPGTPGRPFRAEQSAACLQTASSGEPRNPTASR